MRLADNLPESEFMRRAIEGFQCVTQFRIRETVSKFMRLAETRGSRFMPPGRRRNSMLRRAVMRSAPPDVPRGVVGARAISRL